MISINHTYIEYIYSYIKFIYFRTNEERMIIYKNYN